MIQRLFEQLAIWRRWLGRVLTEPRSELTRWQRAIRFAYLLGLHGARRLRQGRAQEMAGALTFRTLFGLLPVLVVGTLLVRALQGWESFYAGSEAMLGRLGLDTVQVFESDGTRSASLSRWLLDLLAQVETINLTAIGWVGLAVLVYSAIGLMITIENSFNSIFNAPYGRSWVRRVPNYWFVLGLAPAAIALTLLVNERVGALIRDLPTWDWLLTTSSRLWGFGVAWLILFMIYKVVPNTAVATRPAMAGAGVAALLLSIGKASFGAYLSNALSIRQLYGSLGLIPLFMFWVYLMWLFVLYGLEVAATAQTVSRKELEEQRRGRERPHSGLVDPVAVVPLMEQVAARFTSGASIQPRELVQELGLPLRAVEAMLKRLVDEGLLHRLDRSDGAVTLALPPERIDAGRLVDIGYALVDEGGAHHSSPLLERLRAAQRAAVSGSTLGST